MTDRNLNTIVNDDPALVDSFEALLESEGFRVNSYLSGRAFLNSLSAEAPSCVILDLQMPNLDGFEILNRLSRLAVNFPVIVVTAFGDVPKVVQAMRAGAFDFIEKPIDVDRFFERIREGINATEGTKVQNVAETDVNTAYGTLTPRERDVYAQIVKGDPNKVIARTLGISHRTIEIHRAKVMKKMGVSNISQLIRMDMVAGIGTV